LFAAAGSLVQNSQRGKAATRPDVQDEKEHGSTGWTGSTTDADSSLILCILSIRVLPSRWENPCHPWFPEIFSKEQEIT
jgi:hypothetical protein